MTEPENHTLRLLREFREEFASFRRDFNEFREDTGERFARSDERFDELVRLFAGEGVLARYAAADVERRLEALEKRMSVLEEQH